MPGRDTCERRHAGFAWIAAPIVAILTLSGLVGPAFAKDCTTQEFGAKVQEFMAEGLALEKRNPAKYKELDPVLGKILDEDSKPPNDEDSAKICADYDKMIEMVKSAK